jgi:L-seryl-tRNA(Ser) seleniumtransferase
MIEVARAQRVPLLYDEGSGRVVDLAKYGFAPQPTIRELVAAGVDAVTCSTDKLIGATQGGLILGSEEMVGRCRKHPLMRAVRAGKESYAVISETLRAFATERHEQEVTIYGMLAAPLDALRARAEALVRGISARVVESDCALGGGTTPAETIPSVAVAVPGDAAANAARLLAADPPIVGRIVNDAFTIDMRTLLENDLVAVRTAIQ